MALRELIDDERKWCTHYVAIDRHGIICGPTDPNACRWCLMGGLMNCFGDHPILQGDAVRHVAKIIRKLYPPNEDHADLGPVELIGAFNDSHPWEAVRRVIEESRL